MSRIASFLLLLTIYCFSAYSINSLQAKTILCTTITNSDPNFKLFDFHISPNPAKSDINIEFTENISGIIFIHDSLGNQVLELGINNQLNKDVSLGKLNSGIYFISVKTNSKTVIKRLIKY